MGASHTADLELNRDFTLKKNCWDLMSIERIETACNVAKQADVAAVPSSKCGIQFKSY